MIEPYLLSLSYHADERGLLSALEFNLLPCPVKRVFLINVNNLKTKRGGHAHQKCWQVLIPCDYEIEVETQNSTSIKVFNLKQGFGLVVPPKNWVTINFTKTNSSALVLASHPYESDDYLYLKDFLN